jgi:hypothetical protein
MRRLCLAHYQFSGAGLPLATRAFSAARNTNATLAHPDGQRQSISFFVDEAGLRDMAAGVRPSRKRTAPTCLLTKRRLWTKKDLIGCAILVK